jgi:DNA-binding transcriptional LysR family regulator
MIMDACQRRGFTPRIAARSRQTDFIVELAGAGLGAAFLPQGMAEHLNHPGVIVRPLEEPGTSWSIAMIWRRGGYLSSAAGAWLALVRERR